MKKKSSLYRKIVRGLAYVYVFFTTLFKLLKKNKKYLINFLLIVAIVLAVIAGVVWFVNRPKQEIDDGTSEPDVQSEKVEKLLDEVVAETKIKVKDREGLWYGACDVKLEEFCEQYPDCVGWIYFEDGTISYPIMKGANNDTYLRTDYTGEASNAGSIMLEEKNARDFSDRHIILYGHNMTNLAMFGRLKYYIEDITYYKDHQYFQILTLSEDGGVQKCRYHIVSGKQVSEEDDAYYVWDKSYGQIADFARNNLMAGNIIRTEEEIDITNEDFMVTLSTCSADSLRLIVSAVRCGKCVIY